MRRLGKWLAVAFVIAIALQIIIADENGSKNTAAAQTAPAAKNDPMAAARFEQCRATLKKAAATGILHDMDWKPPQDPYVVVGPTYAALRSTQKEALAYNVNCFLMAGEDKCIGFELRDWRTEHPVARYSLCRLEPIN